MAGHAAHQALALAQAEAQAVMLFKMPAQQLAAPACLAVAEQRWRLTQLLFKPWGLLGAEFGRPPAVVVILQAFQALGFVSLRPALDGARVLAKPGGDLVAATAQADQQQRVQAVHAAQLAATQPQLGQRRPKWRQICWLELLHDVRPNSLRRLVPMRQNFCRSPNVCL